MLGSVQRLAQIRTIPSAFRAFVAVPVVASMSTVREAKQDARKQLKQRLKALSAEDMASESM